MVGLVEAWGRKVRDKNGKGDACNADHSTRGCEGRKVETEGWKARELLELPLIVLEA